MTMNGCEFDKPCDGDHAVARDVAAGYLVKLGYVLEGRDEGRVHLKFHGTWFTTAPERVTHHVYVTSRPGALRFEFTTGIVASYWTERDRAFADERAEAAARAAQGTTGDYRTAAAEGPAMEPCRYCGKINLASTPACSCCGAATKGA